MAAVVQEDPSVLPKHEDGSPFALTLLEHSEVAEGAVFADTYDDLVGAMIDGYPVEPETEEERDLADALRIRFLVDVANEMQMAMTLTADAEGRLADATGHLLWVLSGPRDQHIEVPGGAWNIEDLPLVLITTNYAPYTEHERPGGDAIIWLDPTNARTFIRSLVAVRGELTLLEHPDAELPEG